MARGQMGAESDMARVCVQVYSGETLPQRSWSLLTKVRRALVREDSNLSRLCVCVTFSGVTVRTSLARGSHCPVWNQQATFITAFPTDGQHIQLLLLDVTGAVETIVGAGSIEMRQISNSGDKGYLPTFGPAYIHLYGARCAVTASEPFSNDVSTHGQHGMFYRGRLLVSVSGDVLECDSHLHSPLREAEVENISPVSMSGLQTEEDLFMFAAVMEASMIPESLRDRQLSLELSIIPGRRSLTRTCPLRPLISGNQYHLPYRDSKPCLFLNFSANDQKHRFFLSNRLQNLVERTNLKLSEVRTLCEEDPNAASHCLISLMTSLNGDCSKFIDCLKRPLQSAHERGLQDRSYFTQLDEKRLEWTIREMKNLKEECHHLCKSTNASNFKHSMRKIEGFSRRLQQHIPDPQHSIADLFLWLVDGDERLAYCRIPARQIFHSEDDQQSGRLCSKVQSVFLKFPRDRDDSSANGNIAARLQVYLWLGPASRRVSAYSGLPSGHDQTDAILSTKPPSVLRYLVKQELRLLVFLYQARCLVGEITSAVYNPFVQVNFGGHTRTSQVVCQTSSPKWNEVLVFEKVVIYGGLTSFDQSPPTAFIQVFNQLGQEQCDLIGCATVRVRINLQHDLLQTPPRPHWLPLARDSQEAGELLAVIELVQGDHGGECEVDGRDTRSQEAEEALDALDVIKSPAVIAIPEQLQPTMVKYRLEVLFWGLRELKRLHFFSVDRPLVEVECGGEIVRSSTLENYSENPNFPLSVKSIELELPEDELFWPPVLLRVLECRSFGRVALVGATRVPNMGRFLPRGLAGASVWSHTKNESSRSCAYSTVPKDKDSPESYDISEVVEFGEEVEADQENFDWWTKYYTSKHALTKKCNEKSHGKNKLGVSLLKIYPCELECVPEFQGFQDTLMTFNLYRGSSCDSASNDEADAVGKLKGSLRVYPLPASCEAHDEAASEISRLWDEATLDNSPKRVLVRVYILRAWNLPPMDLNGKADPYIVVRLGKNCQNESKNYIPNQLNPVFGKCIEMEAVIPQDSLLTVQLWDMDRFGSDELIGETSIDLENRYYSKHRATCGLDEKFDRCGYNQWRDSVKPCKILHQLCSENQLPSPVYEQGSVRVGQQTFRPSTLSTASRLPSRDSAEEMARQQMALHVLHNWGQVERVGCPLVPAHVETRPLYHPTKLGVERGSLEMWIDLFPLGTSLLPPAVDITPRKPKSYELRVIIWNTEDVVLQDDVFFTGEKMSDIYVKGWLRGPEDCQSTDVHHRSLTGEGNFNWRFIFPFDYLAAEKRIISTRPRALLSWDGSEVKVPAHLNLQIWDSDHFSPDDFLGQLTLDLNSFPRGAKLAQNCSLDMIDSKHSDPGVSLFKRRRIKGWWPFHTGDNSKGRKMTGKVEAEFHLLTAEEAQKYPVGLAREDPDGLDKPSRPDSSFVWFINPAKSLRYIIWRRHKWTIVRLLLLLLLAAVLFVFFFNLPKYIVKLLLGV